MSVLPEGCSIHGETIRRNICDNPAHAQPLRCHMCFISFTKTTRNVVLEYVYLCIEIDNRCLHQGRKPKANDNNESAANLKHYPVYSDSMARTCTSCAMASCLPVPPSTACSAHECTLQIASPSTAKRIKTKTQIRPNWYRER